MNKTTRTLGIATLLGLMFALGACHTVEGAGKDIQEVGEGLEEAAEDART
jgi:predicted small secreted protein